MTELAAADPSHVGKVLFISHCNCLDRAYDLKEMMEARCSFSHILIGPTGGISTVYANDGGIIMAY